MGLYKYILAALIFALPATASAAEVADVTTRGTIRESVTPATVTMALTKSSVSAWMLNYCVTYLREAWGIPIRGDAHTQTPNTPAWQADVGDVLLFKYPNNYHVAVVTKDIRSGWRVSEANYKAGRETERYIERGDPHLIGAIRY